MKKVNQRFLAYRSAAEQMKKVKQRFLAYRSAVGQMKKVNQRFLAYRSEVRQMKKVKSEISGLQIGSEADEDFSDASGVETSLTEEEQLIYDKGYKEALEEFEKAISLEKGSLKDLTETMFSIGDDFQERLEALIKTKICELNNELLDSEIQDFPTPFLNKIKQVAGDILSEIKDVKLELNHADLELLKGSDVVESLGFEVMERSDLRRGEFRLISNSTGFQRELSH